jgi:hypothetical protein
MGRPIKKKFFGNTNSPYQNQGIGGNTGVGGEGAAAVVMINTGTGYLTLPSVSFPAQQIAGGTTATGTVHMQLRSVSITSLTNGGSGYAVGDTLTFANGTGTPAVVRVAAIGGSTVTSVALVSLGDYTALPNGGTTATHTASTGSGLVLNATYAVKSVDVASAGTGYTSTGTLTFGSASGTGAAARFTLTTSSFLNSIALTAFVTGGAARTAGDILKQESSRRYLVKTSDGVGQCRLVTTSTLAAKQMTIVATDVNGSTYFVEKLTARRAVLVKYINGVGGFEYDQREAPKWSINAATTGTVSIANN